MIMPAFPTPTNWLPGLQAKRVVQKNILVCFNMLHTIYACHMNIYFNAYISSCDLDDFLLVSQKEG